MVKYITGKFGRSASEWFAKDFRYKSRHGKLPNINRKEREQVIEMVEKVFKDKIKFKQRDLEKEVLNRLRLSNKDLLNSKEVGEVDKAIGISDHTKIIGTKYLSILRQEKETSRQEKKAEYQNRLADLKADKDKALELKNERKKSESEKSIGEPGSFSWLAALRNKFAQEAKTRGTPSVNYAEKDQKLGGLSRDRYDENDSRLGGIKSNRETPNSMPDRVIPHESPSRDLSHEGGNLTPHTEPLRPPSEFSK